MKLHFAMENRNNEFLKLLMVNRLKNPRVLQPLSIYSGTPPMAHATPINGRTRPAKG
jgi:hypothetical protein